MWHTSHGHGHGSHLAMLPAVWPKMEYFEPKPNNLVKKWVKKVKKVKKVQNPYQKSLMATMVAMVVAKRVKKALLENIFF